MENLHADVLENILFRLPVDAAIQAKRVCTTWRAIIRDKTEKPGGFLFAHAVGDHHDYNYKLKQLFYEDEHDHYHPSGNRFITEIEHSRSITNSVSKHFMVGSCNGLVCFGRENNSKLHPFLIYNPLTGESVYLPEFNYSEWPEDALSTRIGHLASGFGYCPSTSEYKVVTILKYRKHEQEEGYVQVYTVGGGWRYIGFTYRCAFNYTSGVYANGALFWLHQRSTRRVQESEIEAFDLEGEKFHYIALPRSKDLEYMDDNSFPLKLLAGNNNLCLVHSFKGTRRTDIWVYKRDNKNKILSHWLKEFILKHSQSQGATQFYGFIKRARASIGMTLKLQP